MFKLCFDVVRERWSRSVDLSFCQSQYKTLRIARNSVICATRFILSVTDPGGTSEVYLDKSMDKFY